MKLVRLFVASALLIAPLSFAGCDQKEEVLDVETQEGEMEVEQDPETGETDVEIDEK